MKYTYRLTEDPEGIMATCVEMPVSALGPTEAAALAALKGGICERLTHIEAVAPPSSVPVPSFELEPASDAAPPEPQGPGDSPAADRGPPPTGHF
ncbi:MAG TPA: hypothetical protein VK540_31290 [Polyangiaceae bacterium]|jgi:hypothetical protein|nr:hypothetical protein [Polyangiaceae bacterium]